MTEPKKPVLPHGWIVKQSSSYPDRVYYFNIHTGNSTWEVPTLKNQGVSISKPKVPPTSSSKSCLSKPTAPGQTGQTASKKKTVKIAPDPQFSPDDHDNSDEDLLDLNDDGPTSEGHKHHMEILQRPPSPIQKPDQLGQGHYSPDHDIHVASMYDTDLRRGHQPISKHSHSTVVSSQPTVRQQIIQNHPHNSLFTASTVSASTSQKFDEQTLVENVDNSIHFHRNSQFPLNLPIASNMGNSFLPHTPRDLPSMDKDLSTSTLPSVHIDQLPDYLRFSSTPIVKHNNMENSVSARFRSNNLPIDHWDKDFRIQRTVKNEIPLNNAEGGFSENREDKKRRLSDLWKSQKSKRLKTDENIDSDNGILNQPNLMDSSQLTKTLSANDLRHKVRRHDPDKNQSTVVSPESCSYDQARTNKLLMEVDIRKVVSGKVNCDMQELRYDNTIERDRSPVDSDENNIIETENVRIAPDKLLSIQTWIDNIEPGTGHLLEDEDASSKRTSPDSAVLSITYSNDFDNRRIVVEKGPPHRTVDSGISSVSNATVFQPITEHWKNQPNTCWKGVHADQPHVNHNRDIMDMEIDEVQHTLVEADDRDIEDMEVGNIVAKEIRAKIHSSCKFSDIVGDLTQVVSNESRSPGYKTCHKGLFIVVDTNILISHLNFIKDLRDTDINTHGRPILVFPWVVMQELDYLKSGKAASASLSLTTAKKARNAVQYLYNCLQSNHPRIVGQTPAQASMVAGEFVVENNDDRVLQCCKQFQGLNQDSMVVLLTDDRNLCNKSLIMGVKAFTQQLILSQLQTMDRVMTCQGDASNANPGMDDVYEQRAPQRVEQLTSPKDSSFLDDIYCKVKSLIKGALSLILEREMKSTYNEVWENIVFKKPPWCLRDVLECVQKHWIAVFGQIYRRDLIKNIERILNTVKADVPMVWRVVQDMISDMCEVLDADLKHIRQNPEIANYKKSFIDLRSRIPHHHCVQGPNDDKSQPRREKCESWNNMEASSGAQHEPSNTRVISSNIRSPRDSKDTQISPKQPGHRKRRKSGDDRQAKNRKSPTSPGKQTFSKSELKLKSIWNTIQQYCDELKRIAASSNSPQRHVYQMCERLIPAMTDLEVHYNKALSIPAREIRSQLEHVIELCNQLNNFHERLEIEDTEGPIETYDLLDLFSNEDKRFTLHAGLRQLKDMVKDIFICVQQLPDD